MTVPGTARCAWEGGGVGSPCQVEVWVVTGRLPSLAKPSPLSCGVRLRIGTQGSIERTLVAYQFGHDSDQFGHDTDRAVSLTRPEGAYRSFT